MQVGTGVLGFGLARSRSQLPASEAIPNSKLRTAAVEFESILLGEWLEKVEETFSAIPGGSTGQGKHGDEDCASGDYKHLGVEALASVWARSGGIGLSSTIQKQLQPADSIKVFGAAADEKNVAVSDKPDGR